ncbi:MAG: response regulator [Pseudomonadota bacterium]
MSAKDQPNSPANRGERIALIEDDDEVRRSLSVLLRANGFAVEAFDNGVELLHAANSLDADCLLVDYKLPRLDGLALLSRLRDEGVSTPAVLITGYFSNSLDARARAVGYRRVIEKPALAPSLVHGLRDVIENP